MRVQFEKIFGYVFISNLVLFLFLKLPEDIFSFTTQLFISLFNLWVLILGIAYYKYHKKASSFFLQVSLLCWTVFISVYIYRMLLLDLPPETTLLFLEIFNLLLFLISAIVLFKLLWKQ